MPEPKPVRSGVVPRYRQIEAILRDEIWLGGYQVGEQLPTEQELCARHGVSRVTIRQALAMLEQDGLIQREVARGTFVAPRAEAAQGSLLTITQAMLTEVNTLERIALARTGSYVPRGDVRAALQTPEGAEACFFLRVFYSGDEPVGGEQVYVHPAVAASLSAEDMADPAISRRIAQQTQREIGDVSLRLSAITADARHSLRFQTFSGAPLISVLRTTCDTSGAPLEHAQILLRCDRCEVALRPDTRPAPSTTNRTTNP